MAEFRQVLGRRFQIRMASERRTLFMVIFVTQVTGALPFSGHTPILFCGKILPAEYLTTLHLRRVLPPFAAELVGGRGVYCIFVCGSDCLPSMGLSRPFISRSCAACQTMEKGMLARSAMSSRL